MKKKITMLLTSLLCCVGVMAQTLITDASKLSNEKVYTVAPSRTSDGVICVKDGAESTQLYITANATSIQVDPTNISQRFAFITISEKTFMYSLAAEKFVADNGTGQTLLSELTDECLVNFHASTGSAKDNYPLVVEVGGDYLCTTTSGWYTSNGGVVTNWNHTDDDGCMMAITQYDPTEGELALLASAYSICDEYVNSKLNVVFEYYINGVLYHTSDVIEHSPNSAPQVPALDYVTIGATDVETITEDCTVKVTCTENLPFVSSTGFANATWQVIDMHSNENNYTWKYVAEDANVETPVVAKAQNSSLGDEYYWAFVGNLVDGFKIYNKAAGESLTLRKATDGNNASAMSATNDRNVFRLHKSNSSISNSFCFKIDGDSYYLNKQNQTLQGWTAKDEGSSCRVFTPASYPLNALGGFENAPCGAVGSYSYLADAEKHAAFSAAIAPVKANPYDIEALEALDELNMIADIVASEKVALTDGYYRIQNLFRPQTGVKNMIGVVDGKRKGALGNLSNVDFIWNIKTSENGYTLENANRGLFMSSVTDQTLVEEASAAEYTFSDLGAAQWKIQTGGQNLVMFYNDGTLGHWGAVAQNGDGAWYIIPATTVEYTLSDIDGEGYASAYLPFDVTLDSDVKAHAVTATGANNTVILTEMDDIKANEGAILIGTPGTHTFNIATATSDWENNLLEGTTVNTYLATDAYVLANGGEGVGLYKAKLNKGEAGAEGTTHFLNNANKAYLPASAVTSGAQALRFTRGGDDETTSIDNAELTIDNVVIYDLAGRRVEKMEKGIYIVNGKKVIR